MSTGGMDAGYHQNWYAVARSDEVARGQVIGKEFLGGKVAIYRGEDGRARVVSAYCSHLGADLSVGCVIENQIRCAFHHWHYGEHGRCTKIPAAEVIPKKAKLLAFPVAEQWGLIWAFNGAEPLFELPGFPDFGPESLVLKLREHPTIYPVEPWVLISNSHDLQHLKVLHRLKFTRGGVENMAIGAHCMEHDIAFETPDGMAFEQRVRVTGTNTVAFLRKSMFGCVLNMWTGTPVLGGRTKGYLVSAIPRPPGDAPLPAPGPGEAPSMVEQILAMAEGFMASIIEEDEPVMQTIRFREGVLVPSDRELALYLKYVRAFPRANPLADFM